MQEEKRYTRDEIRQAIHKEVNASSLSETDRYFNIIGMLGVALDAFDKEENDKKSPSVDWEIQSFIFPGYAVPISINADKTYGVYKLDLSHFMVGAHQIHSVKRLSDGEVFTIGDKLKNNLDISCLISEIKIAADWDGGIKLCVGINAIGIAIAQKEKPEFMFRTADGTDILAGDSFWYVQSDFGVFPHSCYRHTQSDYEKVKHRCFSTEHAAKEWAFKNKPLLSLNDVYDILYSVDIDADDKSVVHKKAKEMIIQKRK